MVEKFVGRMQANEDESPVAKRAELLSITVQTPEPVIDTWGLAIVTRIALMVPGFPFDVA